MLEIKPKSSRKRKNIDQPRSKLYESYADLKCHEEISRFKRDLELLGIHETALYAKVYG